MEAATRRMAPPTLPALNLELARRLDRLARRRPKKARRRQVEPRKLHRPARKARLPRRRPKDSKLRGTRWLTRVISMQLRR